MVKGKLSSVSSEDYKALEKRLITTSSRPGLLREIVNAPFSNRLLCANIDLGIVVLLLVHKENQTIDRVALSDTELAKNAVRVSAKPFHKIRIPLSAQDNSIVEALNSGNPTTTQDWSTLFSPVLTPEQARQNQQAASIECSLVWPLKAGTGGALIFSFYQPLQYVGDDHLAFAEAYASIVERCLLR